MAELKVVNAFVAGFARVEQRKQYLHKQIPPQEEPCCTALKDKNHQRPRSSTGVLLFGKAKTGPTLVLIDSYHWKKPLNM